MPEGSKGLMIGAERDLEIKRKPGTLLQQCQQIHSVFFYNLH